MKSATYPTHSELVTRAARWLANSAGCSVVLTEMYAAHGSAETPDAIGWQGTQSILVECKVSRADFIADRNKPWRQFPFRGMGARRYYLAPPGIIPLNDLPGKWGLLEVLGKQVRVVQKSAGFAHRERQAEMAFLVSALRRVALRINTPLHEFVKWENRKASVA